MLLTKLKIAMAMLLAASVPACGGATLVFSSSATAQTGARKPEGSQPEVRGGAQAQAPPIVVEGEGSRVESLAWSPNGRMVATVIQLPGRGIVPFTMSVKVWDARTGKHLCTLVERTPRGFCSPVTFSPDSKTVAALVDLKELKLWDTATGKEKATFDVAANAQCWNLAFSPDGKALAAVGQVGDDNVGFDGYVRLFDAKTGKVLWEQTKAHGDRVWGLAFSPDRKTLASGSNDKTAKLWDAATGKLLRTFEVLGEPGRVKAPHDGFHGTFRVAFSPDSKTLASGNTDGTIRIWDVAAGKLRHTIEGYHKELISFVTFSPRDGSLLVAGYPPRGAEEKVGGPIREIRLFDPQTWKAKRTVPVKGLRWLRDLAFSPDGKTLAIGGGNEDVEVAAQPKANKMKLILQPVED